MKTLREVLLEQHQAAEPKLDAIREQVIAGLAPDAPVQAIECRERSAAGRPRSKPAGASSCGPCAGIWPG